jgi:hypothetical protein
MLPNTASMKYLEPTCFLLVAQTLVCDRRNRISQKMQEPVAYSERWRSAFRGDGDRDSEMMSITIPR